VEGARLVVLNHGRHLAAVEFADELAPALVAHLKGA
jgi:hypothetical protein